MLVLLVKEKEDAHTDPEVQPMKDDDIIFGEYRWENNEQASGESFPYSYIFTALWRKSFPYNMNFYTCFTYAGHGTTTSRKASSVELKHSCRAGFFSGQVGYIISCYICGDSFPPTVYDGVTLSIQDIRSGTLIWLLLFFF